MQVAPFLQGDETHSSKSSSHVEPAMGEYDTGKHLTVSGIS